MKRMRLFPALAALAFALLLAGCGGTSSPDPQQSLPAIPRSAAQQLAAASESLAASLEAGDECGAVKQAHDLKKAADAAIASGRIPAAYQDELERAVTELEDDVKCDERPGPPGQEKGHGPDNGKSKKKGHEKHDDDQGGDVEVTTTAATTTTGTTTAATTTTTAGTTTEEGG